MPKRYLVVDQNVLRKPILEELLSGERDTHVVLPDLAFLELTKTDQWEQTLKRSFRILSSYPRRVHVCLSMYEILKRETDTLQPILGNVFNHEATKFVRDLLRSVKSGVDGYAMTHLRKSRKEHIEALSRDHLNHDGNKARLGGLIGDTKERLESDQQKRLRAARATDTERLRLIYDLVAPILPAVLSNHGMSPENVRSFMKRKPLTLRYFYAKEWYSVYWISKGGFDTARPERITNEEIDQEYILSATYFDELLSEEAQVNDCYRDLLSLIAMAI